MINDAIKQGKWPIFLKTEKVTLVPKVSHPKVMKELRNSLSTGTSDSYQKVDIVIFFINFGEDRTSFKESRARLIFGSLKSFKSNNSIF